MIILILYELCIFLASSHSVITEEINDHDTQITLVNVVSLIKFSEYSCLILQQLHSICISMIMEQIINILVNNK